MVDSELRQADPCAQHEEFRRIFDASPDPIVITSVATGRIILVNQEFERLSGHTPAEAVGRKPDELGLWPDPRMREYCAGLLQANGTLRNLGMTFRGKSGEQATFLLSASAITFNGEPCNLAIGRDISEMRKIQGELVAAREAAETASRAKSEFLSIMSHEIRTPMNAILGMADLLAETALDPQQRQFMNLMRNNSVALLGLINNILDLARIESGRMSLERGDFDLRELARGVIDTLAVRAHERELALDLRIAPGLPTALAGDALRVRQVLVNLVGNAIKFTERGGVTLAITQEIESSAAPESPAPGAPPQALIHFAVTDTGIGIARDKLDDVFASFTQADSSTARRYGGSGLGLAIVKRLVDLMDGRVWVESRVGAGSTFHFTGHFAVRPPFAAAAPEASAVAPVPTVARRPDAARRGPALAIAPGRTLEILVADDSVDNRFLLRAYFKQFGAQLAGVHLDEAENGAVALAKFIARRYDVVLMDMQMPVMDGYTAVRQIREWESGRPAANTPIIALTASALSEDVARCMAAGCDLHVSKPVSRATLFAAIAQLLAPATTPHASGDDAPLAAD
ncbi:MAG TPA: ATP-binding protein [Candidatus Binataceae bacterium]|nr:ATP-binding protein [Candidatus Binataceae bacterium]HVC44889.1 ATP-binding protein [Candidatus Binataceae bacterium]